MAELEIDQSNLPRVQEVCQCFAVLEDGALAHNLQEQEIEQYYTTNIEKNQLVQNDIRVAKMLQDEEEEQRAQQSALLRQASRQLEEEDFEYARIIQEELQRCAEEAQKREQDDEEIAKRLQEEEEQRIRRSRGQEGHCEGSASDPALPSPHHHTLSSLHQGEEQYSSTTTRWQCSTSLNHSDLTELNANSPRGVAAQRNTTSWSNQGHTHFREIKSELREPLSEDSEDSDTVFSEQLSVLLLNERFNTAPPQRGTSLHQPQERNYRSLSSGSSRTDKLRNWEEESGQQDEDYYENGDLDKRRPRYSDLESNQEEYKGLHKSRYQDRYSRLVEVREIQRSRSESVRLHDRSRQNNRDLVRTGSYKGNPDKHVRNYRSFFEEERGKQDEDYYENGDLEKRRPRIWDQDSNSGEGCEGLHRSSDQDRDSRLVGVRERRHSRSESVRLHESSRQSNRDLVRTWSYKDNPDKHVRFQENTRSSNKQQADRSGVWEMLGQVLIERGVPVRFGSNGAPLQIQLQSRDSQVLHGSEVSYGDSQPHQRVFQRAASTRKSFHGDIGEGRRFSYRENSGRDHREDRDRHRINVDDGEVYEISSRGSYLANCERRGSRRWSGHRCSNDDERERNADDCRFKRTTSKQRHWHKTIEERLSSEEEPEMERRGETLHRRAPRRSQSLSSSGTSSRDRSRHMAAGVSLEPEPGETSLDMVELQQVLQDEELAHKLQEEEEKLLRRSSQHSPCRAYPERDFRVAQVAQDEEIARFMQKQEMKSKRRSRELEGPASWREHRAMISHHDRRAARDRQVQRERLDSEGLPSPTEDCSPGNQSPSPDSTLPQVQQIRNIAEELDPTFQARRQDTGSFHVGQTEPTCQSLPMPHSGLRDFLEEPTFIPPTKRPTEKSGRTKPKEKKENCKQQ
ncbi:coiled-coil domain-containing protein 187 isoform X1 [Micropterus dolomieu]|uniref:coiled-coil domain-containing protein 187 isoform X1 n=1 Tax=Micropterus dolomieu TaxID=147949 RepID=UPI001E8E5244|nr:coiled-coil domain-containing protein 187 isoform X1 [Micropterus dolomieu]